MKKPKDPCKECIVRPTCTEYRKCDKYYEFKDEKRRFRNIVVDILNTIISGFITLTIPIGLSYGFNLNLWAVCLIWFGFLGLFTLTAFLAVLMEG
jgi:uncharacterized protein (DUF983 family)